MNHTRNAKQSTDNGDVRLMRARMNGPPGAEIVKLAFIKRMRCAAVHEHERSTHVRNFDCLEVTIKHKDRLTQKVHHTHALFSKCSMPPNFANFPSNDLEGSITSSVIVLALR